ncbi:16S rRNA (cytosine(1402)-N(4))-methyltransferase RsmH [Ligilactobacillus agilis]|uniref:Ribosomal RNA small subunit methyltransferase H n=1 Tax=Ligilactobacillus agilis TaxID=1601 RepID=A0A9Q9J626_9LACO|nr:16S rRNA (cytosine(1402)-N(4))-methyltransferase RsmH [Ligilactobacillus agilis]MBM6763423.1 16S rRNA (cytosine(1402)-N(4))-methyltransferase RsmH [Ligilactobacillus agilis]MDO4597058.1 16S rRNA (cytosine(1402)-N(4))-methyltransferase RsmH [Ligilactobacillus agilis]UNL42854.1 16S rRNA (cytosine(1402)-N(4))-methyltransferase RsmH [Ligilactobacillus agilis]UNL58041.1 16S rRNA (cytosine(1402)-N(4))-methyltransferase RsmH [Ligilactobacillus agilis]UXC62847.1 16S rRNA (cytosine(1402)-N(4))-methy
MTEFEHVTVLLNEAVDNLNIKADGIYVDCTLGGGGHSRKILEQLGPNGHLYAFDQDQTALDYNQENLRDWLVAKKLTLIKSNFQQLKQKLAEHGVSHVDGVLYDLGVSSPQFDVAERGFSYRQDAILDMRMDQSQALTARKIVNEWSYGELVRIFTRYGEEKFAKSIARQIERKRQEEEIQTTGQLVELIKAGIPAKARRKGGHPAKKVFQALRIAVNNELGVLEDSLGQALSLLNPHGRISVITFQSLEDRLVKTMFKEKTSLPELPRGLPVIPSELELEYRLVNRKPITPSQAELEANHRAHSAKLRVIEKV